MENENICLKCRHELDIRCPAKAEMVEESVGEMVAYAIACVHFAPKLTVIKGGR